MNVLACDISVFCLGSSLTCGVETSFLRSPKCQLPTDMNLFGAYLIAFVEVIGLRYVSVPRLVSFSQAVKEHVILQLTLKHGKVK